MKAIMLSCAAFVAAVALTGCQSVFTPYNTGVATGAAVYAGYTKVAENQGTEFKEKVYKLWQDINKIETKEDLVASVDVLNKQFQDILNTKGLSENDIALLKALSNKITEKVQAVMEDKLVTNDDALQFLIGARDGVNEMIKLYQDEKAAKAVNEATATIKADDKK